MLHTRIFWSLCFVFILTTWGSAQISADFSASVTTGCGSLQVSFTDESTSTNAINNWSWDLGGVSAGTQNPGRIFGNPGRYDICLTVTDTEGNSDTNCKSEYIEIFPLPIPDFTVSGLTGCAPLEVVFSDQSSSDGVAIEEWIWGVGGSSGVIVTTDPTEEIINTYNAPDNYTVSLTIQDANNCSNTITRSDLITVFPDPEIDITIDEPFGCNIPFTANFNNNNFSNDITYVWNFGNGEFFTGATPSPIIYSEPGTYDITVTAMNPNTNCSTTEIFSNILQVGFPVEIDYSSSDNCEGTVFTFMDNSIEPADSVLWDFGDGNFSTEINPEHAFDQGGCFDVSLTRFTQGCPSEGRITECLLIEAAPTAFFFNNNPAGCTLPHTISYAASSNNDDNTWWWNFGDGTTSSEQQPTHTYDAYGVYPIRLRVTNSNGCVSLFRDTVHVIETEVQLTGPNYWGCTPYEFTLDESSTTAVPINSWEWSIFDDNNVLIFSSSEENPTHTLVDTGLYNVQLTVVNEDGCSSTGFFEGAVAVGEEVIPNFSATPLETCIDAIVDFTDLSSDNANFWIWDYGDGVVVEDVQNPSHEYRDTGYFDVQLFAFHYGCFSEITYEDLIHVNPPIGRARVEQNCENPFAVTFVDRSFGVDSVYWDFGEANLSTDTSTVLSPTHVFADTGCYKVIHSVFNLTTDCVDHDTINICISDPRASFNLNNTDGCAPLEVTVDDNSIFAETYEWIAPGAVISDPESDSPTFTFETPGIYNDVMLVITDIQECPDTFRTSENILARGLVVNFDTDVTGGCLPLTVNFSDNSVSAFSTPLTWSWNIGNGLFTSNEESFTFTFDTVGNFSVELIVTDGDGCTVRRKRNNVIEVTDPEAAFTADTTSCTADVVKFEALATGDLTYLWDFGDGNTSSEEAPEHNYAQEGTYNVCLSIVNQYGCSDMQCKENYITIADPVANFTVDSTFAFCPPLLARFTNTSTNSNYYEWNFGDLSGTSDLENPPHVYTIPGSYSVTLIAGNTENCRDTLIINDLITLNGPVGDFDFVVDTSCAPMQVHFTGTSTDFYDYIWDFGNGVLDTFFNVNTSEVTYAYPAIDTYVPKLILIDESNCARAIESPDSIRVTGINVDFLATDSLLCGEDLSTSFINLSQSTTPITSVEWILPGSLEGNTLESEPTVTYPVPGVYDVSLFVTTEFCQDTLTKPNYIRIGSIPDISFQASETTGCAPFTVDFSDMSTTMAGAITNWNWDFGDGETAGQPDPSHVFNNAGNYQTVLTVGTDFGCEASDSIEIEVLAAPDIELNAEQSICRGEIVTLTPVINGSPDQLTFTWTGGSDLSCTNCLEPEVSPTSTTTYEFTATNPEGCVTTLSTTVNVLAAAIPVIGISPDTAICVSDGIQLNVTGGNDVFSYEWDESRPGLTCYQFCANPIANPLAATTYVVTVTNGVGCSAIDSVTIDLVDQFQPLSGEDRIICQGDSVTLATGVAGLEWTNPVNLSCAYCPDPIAFPDSTTIYNLETFTEEGCLIQDSVKVTVLTQEEISAGEDLFLCQGGSITLNGLGIGDINWSPDISLSDPANLNTVARPMTTTTYQLSITQDLCVLTDTVLITVVDKTTIESVGADICNGDTINLNVTGNADIFEWTSPESLSDPNSSMTDAFPNITTTYTVIGTLTDCPADTALITVNVDEGPSVILQEITYALPNIPLVIEPTVDTMGNYQYSWFPSEGLSCTECLRPIVDSAFIGTIYTLLVTDMDTGCEKELSTTTAALVSCPDEILWVPSAFSPNEDGLNDELKVNSGTLNEINSFQIFDRWGALLFRTDDMRLGWDGRLKNERVPIGVYVYFVEATCPVNNSPILIKGDVTLVR